MNALSSLQRSHDNVLPPEDNNSKDDIKEAISYEFKGVHGQVISIIEDKIKRLSDELSAGASLELLDKFGNVCFDIDSATEYFLIKIQDIIAKAAIDNPREFIDYED